MMQKIELYVFTLDRDYRRGDSVLVDIVRGRIEPYRRSGLLTPAPQSKLPVVRRSAPVGKKARAIVHRRTKDIVERNRQQIIDIVLKAGRPMSYSDFVREVCGKNSEPFQRYWVRDDVFALKKRGLLEMDMKDGVAVYSPAKNRAHMA